MSIRGRAMLQDEDYLDWKEANGNQLRSEINHIKESVFIQFKYDETENILVSPLLDCVYKGNKFKKQIKISYDSNTKMFDMYVILKNFIGEVIYKWTKRNLYVNEMYLNLYKVVNKNYPGDELDDNAHFKLRKKQWDDSLAFAHESEYSQAPSSWFHR